MIVKKRSTPLIIKQEEVLERRLPKDHPKRPTIIKSLKMRKAGLWGEQELDYPLSFLPQNQYQIFHDVRLIEGKKAFQIDTLILTDQLAIILEVKNISGIIEFDSTFDQLIRKLQGREERLPNPLAQVGRQRRQLANWFASHNIFIPIKCFVVMTHPSCVLKASEINPHQHTITHVENLQQKIIKLEAEYISEHKLPSIINKIILNAHTPLGPIDVLNKYGIHYDDLRKGVECPRCLSSPMKWMRRRWRCSSCYFFSSDAHLRTISDYFLLGYMTINNAAFRELIQHNDQAVSKYFLSKMNLQTSGHKRSLLYHSPHPL
ncbi:NERD domain-containing protein [Pontibacillus sp. ALD_SL1]|uniref:nuclease-related domain-containing protein n=1 Tax=Pontibacillus sp. ALD_SL1 TaxID=2777185 RepID=UPI001A96DBBC|nr:nuclease-related domain-containing protein [Pontibacillus sp. ALD_SL1]QSS98912.1 NERD domain-containing protein [Pontibacillus sp. ALD_SL1]